MTRRLAVVGMGKMGRAIAELAPSRGWDVVATSEVSVSLTIDDDAQLDAIVRDLRGLGDVSVERNRGIVAVVGSTIAEGGLAMARALDALGDVRVHMLSLSASGINLTMVVDGEQVKPAMQRLHAAFFEREEVA